jgi:N-acetyl-1-D-myo-inositol-2-amino-2-deoxy-alpha-D-glucopyranoside deacetylase
MDRRLLLVHAHPDDESIFTGATMARYAAEGAGVTLVTCTAGEEGEVLPPEIGHLAADQDDALGPHRVAELEAAMACLGVTDHRYLGGAFRFRDSGMQWGPDRQAMPRDETAEGTFWRADLTAASDLMAEIIRDVRPHVLVTYDEFGGYGHPDHVQAHRVAMYGAMLAAVESYRRDLGAAWDIPKIYWIAATQGPMRTVPESDLAAVIDGAGFGEAKVAALRAHSSQIDRDGPFITHVWLTEAYRLAKGVAVPPPGARLEDDLFAGLSYG